MINPDPWLGTGTISTGTGQPTYPCPYCGMGHSSVCHRVKAMEYYPDGTLKRVELHEPKPLPDGYGTTVLQIGAAP